MVENVWVALVVHFAEARAHGCDCPRNLSQKNCDMCAPCSRDKTRRRASFAFLEKSSACMLEQEARQQGSSSCRLNFNRNEEKPHLVTSAKNVDERCDVFCCDGCPRVWHKLCTNDEARREIEEEIWYCEKCLDHFAMMEDLAGKLVDGCRD